jgi:DNA mismatch repair protein MutS2
LFKEEEDVNTDVLRKLEYDTVLEQVRQYALSYRGRARIEEMRPLCDVDVIRRLLNETEEARKLVESGSSAPIPTLEGMDKVEPLLGKGYVFSESDIAQVYQFLESTRQLKKYLIAKADRAPRITAYADALDDLESVRKEIERCIACGSVADDASSQLAKVRKQLRVVRDRLKKKLDTVLQKYSAYLQESLVRQRNGRYVIAVKKSHKRMVGGVVVDESASGQTVFMEPSDLVSLQQEIAELEAEEALEVNKVLSVLTGRIEVHTAEIQENLRWIEYYDVLFARAKYAQAVDGKMVSVNAKGHMTLRGARHPLLGRRAVPLNVAIGREYRALIVTGPNTGGKTVTLKTVGLLAAMVQSGLLPPVEEASEFPVFTDILADIGDGQSLEQSLSTFSSHVRNVIQILEETGPNTLVLLDELATGTDPGEGVGLSIAVLKELYDKGATIVANTHFNEIKRFAGETAGFENARMEFDTESMKPLYRLKVGEAGMSYAYVIARQLGMPERIIQRATAWSEKRTNPVYVAAPQRKEKHGGDPAAVQRGSDKGNGAERPNAKTHNAQTVYEVGDRVWVHPLRKSGIVYKTPDEKGNLVVLVQKQQHTLNVKRVAPYLKRDELYPDNYDLDIVLESKEVRKKRKMMSRKHVAGLSIEHPPID